MVEQSRIYEVDSINKALEIIDEILRRGIKDDIITIKLYDGEKFNTEIDIVRITEDIKIFVFDSEEKMYIAVYENIPVDKYNREQVKKVYEDLKTTIKKLKEGLRE